MSIRKEDGKNKDNYNGEMLEVRNKGGEWGQWKRMGTTMEEDWKKKENGKYEEHRNNGGGWEQRRRLGKRMRMGTMEENGKNEEDGNNGAGWKQTKKWEQWGGWSHG